MMNTYNIYLKKDENGAIDDMVMVKKGFNFYTMIGCGIFWFLFKALWVEAGILFVVFSIINSMDYFFDFVRPYMIFVVETGIILYCAFEANERLEIKLKKKGYELIGNSYGRSEDEAKVKILDDLKEKYTASENFQIF